MFVCNLMWSLQFTCIKLTQDQVGPYFTVWAPMLLATLFLAPFALREFNKGGKKIQGYSYFWTARTARCFPGSGSYDMGYTIFTGKQCGNSDSLPAGYYSNFCISAVKGKNEQDQVDQFYYCDNRSYTLFHRRHKTTQFRFKICNWQSPDLLAIVGNAYYNTGIKKIAARYTEIELVFFTYIVMVILLTPLVMYLEHDVFARIPSFTLQTWTGMTLLTVFHNFLSMILFFKALKMLDAMQVALSNYLIAFFGLPVAAIWLGETLNMMAIAGGILVLISTLIITIVDYRMTRTAKIKTTG